MIQFHRMMNTKQWGVYINVLNKELFRKQLDNLLHKAIIIIIFINFFIFINVHIFVFIVIVL